LLKKLSVLKSAPGDTRRDALTSLTKTNYLLTDFIKNDFRQVLTPLVLVVIFGYFVSDKNRDGYDQ